MRVKWLWSSGSVASPFGAAPPNREVMLVSLGDGAIQRELCQKLAGINSLMGKDNGPDSLLSHHLL